MDFKVQHPKPDFSTGGVPRVEIFRECFAPLVVSNLTLAVNRQPGFRREDS